MRELIVVCALFLMMMLSLGHLLWHLKKGDVRALDFAQVAATSIAYIGASYAWYLSMT